ncbi:MAG: ATP synthase subunit I [Oscillospiraceae bacterium]|nr:ATP synthase subunit I [Oscillospiraceae bacterium]
MKIEPAVRKETMFVSGVSLILSAVMQAVFLILGKWDYTILLGNVLGVAVSIGNFFLMCLAIQKAVGEEKEQAAKRMKMSQSLRMLMVFVVLVLGAVLDCFNILATVIPLFFVRIAVTVKGLRNRKGGDNVE